MIIRRSPDRARRVVALSCGLAVALTSLVVTVPASASAVPAPVAPARPQSSAACACTPDSSAKQDVIWLGGRVGSYYIDSTSALRSNYFRVAGGRYNVYWPTATGQVLAGVRAINPAMKVMRIIYSEVPAAHHWSAWCVQLTYTGGTHKVASYSAQDGFRGYQGCPVPAPATPKPTAAPSPTVSDPGVLPLR